MSFFFVCLSVCLSVCQSVTHQVENGSVQAKRRQGHGSEQNLHCPALQRGEVEIGRPVVLGLVLLLVFVLDLPLLALEVQDGPSLRVVQGGRAVEGAQEEREEHHTRHSLETQSPALMARTEKMDDVTLIMITSEWYGLPSGSAGSSPHADLNEDGHGGDADAAGGHHDDLDQVPLPLEVLSKHQSGRISGQTDANAWIRAAGKSERTFFAAHTVQLAYHDAIAEEELVKLTSEGGEETAQGSDEASEDGSETRRLPPADAHGQRGDEQGQGEGQGAQPAWREREREREESETKQFVLEAKAHLLYLTLIIKALRQQPMFPLLGAQSGRFRFPCGLA